MVAEQRHAKQCRFDGFVVPAQQHADLGERRECLRFTFGVADLLEQLCGAPGRIAGAPQPRADAVAVRQARQRAGFQQQVVAVDGRVQQGLRNLARLVNRTGIQRRPCRSERRLRGLGGIRMKTALHLLHLRIRTDADGARCADSH
ncbi:MAG TPA: hypothetical protein VIO33_19845 [Burkholderiaceae bacterium]